MRNAAFAGAIAALLVPAAVQAQDAATVPKGPSSLQETYRDWRVVCVQQDEAPRRCAVSQELTRQDGRRILALEMSLGDDGETAAGTLVIPFGLALEEGLALVVGDAVGERLRFRTCLPVGCIVPLTLTASVLAQLRGARALEITAAASDTGQSVSFAVSLDGFDQAIERMAEFARR